MIKVVDKAFDIMAVLAESPEQPRMLSDIAGRLNMHPATCANILKTMVARDYVEQIAPKKGYILGPAVYALTRNGPYRKDLVVCARQAMEDLAASVNETVLLAIIRNGRRFTLASIDGSRTVKVGGEFLYQENIYNTATGRLLLAYLSEAELKKTLERNGSPARLWPEARTISGLRMALAEARKRGFVCHSSSPDTAGIAFPIVGREEKVVAALGLFLPLFRFKGSHRHSVLKGMRQTAKRISRSL